MDYIQTANKPKSGAYEFNLKYSKAHIYLLINIP